jgi:hypothetical protein
MATHYRILIRRYGIGESLVKKWRRNLPGRRPMTLDSPKLADKNIASHIMWIFTVAWS